MEKPLISIIMPMYGVEKYISNAIESVLKQTYTNWQLIIVNDGTKDGSRHIAECYRKIYNDKIMIVDKANGGLSDARNYGLRYVKGEYLHFFDSDDFITPNFYKDVMESISDSNFDFIITGYTVSICNEKNQVVCTHRHEPPKRTFNKQFIRDNIASCRTFLDFAWNKIYKTSFIRNNDLQFDKNLYLIEDAEFMGRVFKASLNFAFEPECGYYYCQYPRKSLSNSFSPRIIELCAKRIYILDSMLDVLGIIGSPKKEIISRTAFVQYKHILNTLFESESFSKSSIIDAALNTKYLYEATLSYHPDSFSDKIVCYCIKNKMKHILAAFYSLKKTIKRIA